MALGAIPTIDNATPTSSTHPLASQHFWNLSPAMQIVMLGAKRAPLYMMLSRGIGMASTSTTDKRYVTLSEHPMITDLLIKGATGAGADAAITTTSVYFSATDPTGDISDMNKILRVGDKLLIHPLQDNQTTALTTVAAGGEYMKVLEIAADGTYFTVQRNFGSTATTANVAADSTKTLHAKVIPASRGEKSRSRPALAHAMIEDYNYIESFSEPFDVTDDVRATTLAGGDMFPREQNQKLLKLMGDIEEAILNGKRSATVVDGDPVYTTRGFIPYVVGDGSTYAAYTAANDLVSGNGLSRIWRPGTIDNFNLDNWLTLMSRLYTEGMGNKLLLCGLGFYTTFLQSLEGYLNLPLVTNTGESLGMSIGSWNHGISGASPLKIMQHHAFNGPRWNDAVILDLDYIGLKTFGTGDISIWKGKGGTGMQENDVHTTKWAWEAQVGADMSYGLAHAYIQGIINDNGTYGGINQTVGTLDPSNT